MESERAQRAARDAGAAIDTAQYIRGYMEAVDEIRKEVGRLHPRKRLLAALSVKLSGLIAAEAGIEPKEESEIVEDLMQISALAQLVATG